MKTGQQALLRVRASWREGVRKDPNATMMHDFFRLLPQEQQEELLRSIGFDAPAERQCIPSTLYSSLLKMASEKLENTRLLNDDSSAAAHAAQSETARGSSEGGIVQQVSWRLLFLGLTLLLIGILVDYTHSDRRISSSSVALLRLSKQNTPSDGSVLLQGFGSLSHENYGGNPYSLQWYCAPDSWEVTDDTREGRDGSWKVRQGGSQLRLYPPAKKDFWRKTYYVPILIKDDGSVAYTTLDAKQWYTLTTSFTLRAVRQFDQAGLYLRLDSEHWLKTGIEVVDHIPRLSAVVTNVYSDWSTQAWPDYTTETRNGETRTVVECQLKLHVRGSNFVVEAKEKQASSWSFVRIAHLNKGIVYPNDPIVDGGLFQGPSPPDGKVWAGVFAASPEDQRGSFVDFHDFSVVAGSSFEHNADGN